MTRRAEGEGHELKAAEYLCSQGLKLVDSNYHSRMGEIDLIMQDGDSIVFVEVRYRKNSHYGGAAMSITPAKQRKIALTALHYLQSKNKTNEVCRFDAVTISVSGLNWIKNAFDSPL